MSSERRSWRRRQQPGAVGAGNQGFGVSGLFFNQDILDILQPPYHGSIVNFGGLSVSFNGRTQVAWDCRKLPSQADMSISVYSTVRRTKRITSGAETPYKSETLP